MHALGTLTAIAWSLYLNSIAMQIVWALILIISLISAVQSYIGSARGCNLIKLGTVKAWHTWVIFLPFVHTGCIVAAIYDIKGRVTASILFLGIAVSTILTLEPVIPWVGLLGLTISYIYVQRVILKMFTVQH